MPYLDEKRMIVQMIGLYCREKHGSGSGLCEDCLALLEYARQRLSRCPHGSAKPLCSRCTIHCYAAGYRENIRGVMRYAGPRFILRHPVSGVKYLIKKLLPVS